MRQPSAAQEGVLWTGEGVTLGGSLLNLDIEVAPELTVRDAHDVAHRIKEAVRRVAGVTDAVIHVDVHGE